MTKSELMDYLKAGYFMNDAFDFGPGQNCEIFKADSFSFGDEIIYIPDASLNEIPMNSPITDEEIIEEVVDKCYTGYDFIELCGGNEKMARDLFSYVDWQHPSSAYPEVAEDYEDEEETK